MTTISTSNYDNPNFLIVRHSTPISENTKNGSISAVAVASEYVGSTLKVCYKAAITGVAFQIQSGGSLAGTNSISVARIIAGGANSIWYTKTIVTSVGASMANDVHDISLASAMTLTSMGDTAHLWANAASIDKCCVLKNIVWRYRLVPQTIEYADSP